MLDKLTIWLAAITIGLLFGLYIWIDYQFSIPY